jgi:hypothetical protein
MENLNLRSKRLIALTFLLVIAQHSFGQLERKRVASDPAVELTFNAPRNINFFTVEPVEAKGLHFNIMHTFGQ